MTSKPSLVPPTYAKLASFIASSALSLTVIGAAAADNLDCGQPISSGATPTATDALFILNVAVGFGTCEFCVCDTDDSGSTTATDALRTLSRAVGVPVDFACPGCDPVSLCDGLVAISASGDTFDRIDIGDVPQVNDALWAVLTPQAGDDGVAPVLIDPEGNEQLMVPLHPTAGVAGGTVEVTITDGIETCPIGSLEILPLPAAAADTSANVLAAFLALIDAIAADFGETGADLAITPLDQLPSALIPSALGQIVLAGPNNENSFAALLAGTAPLLDGDTDLDLLNRLLAKIELESALDDLLANRSGLTPGPAPAQIAQAAVSAAQGMCGELLDPVELEIADAAELSRLMREGQEARDGQLSLGNGVIADSIGTIFGAIGAVFGPANSGASMLLYAWSLHQRWLGNLYPSALTKIEFDVEDGGRFLEDRMDGGGGGQPPYPKWSNPQLHATSVGMEVSREVVEDLIEFLSFLPITDLDDDPALQASLAAANDALEFLGNDGCRSIPPEMWGPIGDADDPMYVEAIYFGDSVTEIIEFGCFEPVAFGTTQLRVRTTDAFSGPQVSEEKDLVVVRKQISIQVPTVTVEPGDPVEVIATIVDSNRPEEVEWEYPGFVVNPMMQQLSETEYKLSFTSPTDRMLYPFEVRAFSTSLELPPASPAREGKATIKTESGIVIEPRGGCVSNGQPFDLTATVTGLAESEDDSVNWSQFGAGNLVPGSDNTAVYTAPNSGEGEVLIEAELNIDGDVTDEISLLYGACDINLDLGWYAGSTTFDPDLPGDIDQMKSAYNSGPLFPQPGDVLVPPAPWWDGRSHNVSTQSGSTYLQPVRDDMGVFHDLSLSSATQIDAQFTSSGPGAAALSMSWSTAAECLPIPNSANGIECSSGRAQFDWTPVIWIEVSEAGTYDAQFTMNCTRSGEDGFFAVGADTLLRRHVGGAASGGFPNGGTAGPNINGLNPFEAVAPPPLPFPIGGVDLVCEPGSPVDVTATWELGAPNDPSKPDIVALKISLLSFMVSPVDYLVVLDPPVGSYTQSGTMTGTVTVTKRSP